MPYLVERRVRAEQLRMLFRSPSPLIGSSATTLVMAGVLWNQLDHRVVFGWATGMLAWTTVRLWLWLSFRRGRHDDEKVLRFRAPIIFGVMVTGAFWAVLSVSFYVVPAPEIRAVVAFIVASMVTGGALSYAAYLPAHHAYVAACILPMVIFSLWVGSGLSVVMGGVLCLYFVLMLVTGRGNNRATTDTIRVQYQNAALVGDLRAANEAAEQADRAKSQFLANMSHELRTPLNAIIGFSQLIVRQLHGRDAAEKYREYAGLIEASGQHLLKLVNQVLDLSKAAAGELQLSETEFEPAPLLRQCVDLAMGEARQKNITIAVSISAGVPALVADELRIKQAVLNLLSNAIKFSYGGGAVTLSMRVAESGDAVITVSDAGIGMRPEDVPVALQPFRQVDGGLGRANEGTGLGLPLAKMLIEKHGGSLAIDTVLGRGTTVTITLPARRLAPSSRAVLAVVPAE